MTTGCIFCKILSREELSSIVYQDTVCTALLDIQPINPGHVLIIPNQHVADLEALDEETGAHLFRVAQQVAQVLRDADVRCEGINLFLADGTAAGQEIFHLHLHVFPRYAEDGFALQFGAHYWNKPARSTLDAIAHQIKPAMTPKIARDELRD